MNKRQRRPKGQSKTLEKTEGAIKNVREDPIKNGQFGETANVWYTIQDTGQIKVREDRRGNQKWTIWRNWQHRVRKTQDK